MPTPVQFVTLDEGAIAAFWGRFDRRRNGCWLWTGATSGGRVRYGLVGLPNGKMTGAHRLAWILTHGRIPDGVQVLHKCDVGLCGSPDHLFLGTQQENVDDMMAKGRFRATPIDVKQLQKLWTLFGRGVRVPRIATELGVIPGSVNAVLRGESWNRQSRELGYTPVRRGKGNYAGNANGFLGERNPRAKLTAKEVVKIRALCGRGSRQRDVARKFGVSNMTVSYIVRRKLWAHVCHGSTIREVEVRRHAKTP